LHRGLPCDRMSDRCKKVECTGQLWHHPLVHGANIPMWRRKPEQSTNVPAPTNDSQGDGPTGA
jgi:hypothetical protein